MTGGEHSANPAGLMAYVGSLADAISAYAVVDAYCIHVDALGMVLGSHRKALGSI